MRKRLSPLIPLMVVALAFSPLPAAAEQHEVKEADERRTDTVRAPETVSEDIDVRLAEESDGLRRSAPVKADIAFSMINFELPDGVEEVKVRTSVGGEEWTEWATTDRVDADDGPDAGTDEEEADRSDAYSEPVWVEQATHLQVELEGDGTVDHLTAVLVDSVGHNDQPVRETAVEPEGASTAVDAPDIITRAEWGADESLRGEPSYGSDVELVVVHHTGFDSSSDPAAVMRSMYHDHVVNRGWNDLGYNIVVAPNGDLYEGRYGGVDESVIGAHAAGYNTDSFGVSVMGDYSDSHPSDAVYDALADVIAWKADVHGYDPEGTVNYSGENLDVIVGHTDVGNTICPGVIHQRLDWIAAAAAERLEPGPEPFPDVPESSVHREAVVELAAAGIIQGYPDGTFRPSQGVTRGQMSTFLARALDLDAPGESEFTDVDASHPHHDGIHAVHEHGIVQGYPDGTFLPEQDVRRDQAASFIANGFGLEGGSTTHFTDVPADNPHVEGIDALYQHDVTQGCGDAIYCPGDSLRRDQAATFLYRAID